VAALSVLVWAVANLALTLALARRWRPSPVACGGTIAMDLVLGVELLFFILGPSSLVGQAFFLVVIASAIRLGTAAAVATALISASAYGVAEGVSSPVEVASRIFLFLSLALVVGLMAQELDREQRVAVSRAAQADTMREMSATMASSLDIKDVFAVILQHALRMTGAEAGGLLLVLDESVDVAAGEEFEESAVRGVAKRGEPSLSEGQMLVPLASGEGVVAVLGLRRRRPFASDELFTVNALAGSAAVPLANALRYRRSTREASSDPVTGLLNHREMRRRLQAELSWRPGTRRTVSFILLDLDHFKAVNDSMGHQHGDEILRAAARLVRATVRAQDLVARHGGDEMSVIVLESTPEGALALCQRLLDAVHEARITGAPGQLLTFSLGVATIPGDALSTDQLIVAADQALYMAKRGGRDRVHSFQELVNSLAKSPDALLQALHEAGPQLVVAAGHAIDRAESTPGRSSAVALVAEVVARRAGVSLDMEELRTACFLQDMGRVSADSRMHALEGERLLIEAGFSTVVAKAVRHHHERWDGTGTPDGVVGDRIPLEARLIALAGSYEAAVRGRNGEPILPTVAVESLHDEGAFDPDLITALRAAVEEQLLPALPPAHSAAEQLALLAQ
jgi:diguanylate cyclase (GGDEF)-like protein